MFADPSTFSSFSYQGNISSQLAPEMRVSRAAHRLFENASRDGWISRLFGRSAALVDLSRETAGQKVSNRYSKGIQVVSIDDIRGSEGRCKEFDAKFHPLEAHTRFRWERVATAREDGAGLPAVDLIQVGETYFVRDGHHRISVARARGEKAIEANVIVWEI